MEAHQWISGNKPFRLFSFRIDLT